MAIKRLERTRNVHGSTFGSTFTTVDSTTYVTVVPPCPQGTRRHVFFGQYDNNAAANFVYCRILLADGVTDFNFMWELCLANNRRTLTKDGTNARWREPLDVNLTPGDVLQSRVFFATTGVVYMAWEDEY